MRKKNKGTKQTIVITELQAQHASATATSKLSHFADVVQKQKQLEVDLLQTQLKDGQHLRRCRLELYWRLVRSEFGWHLVR